MTKTTKTKTGETNNGEPPNHDGQPTHDLLLVPYCAIDVDSQENARRKIGEVAELAESIRKKGLLEPLLVIRLASPQGELGDDMVPRVSEQRYKLVAGYRRHKAIGIAVGSVDSLALAQWPTPVSVMRSDTNADDVIGANLIENLQREELHSYDLARGFLRLSEEHGLSGHAIARLVAKSAGYVNNLLRALRELAPEIAQRWADHDPLISPRVAIELSALPIPEQLVRLAKITGLTKSYHTTVTGEGEGEDGEDGKPKDKITAKRETKARGVDAFGRPLPTIQAELALLLDTGSGFALPPDVRKKSKDSQAMYIRGAAAALNWTTGSGHPPVSGAKLTAGARGRPRKNAD